MAINFLDLVESPGATLESVWALIRIPALRIESSVDHASLTR